MTPDVTECQTKDLRKEGAVVMGKAGPQEPSEAAAHIAFSQEER